MIFIRSLLFNIVFFGGTAVLCFLYLPTLLMPRPLYMKFIRFYFRWVYWMEKYIIGLDYRIEGLENLPKKQAFLIAMKHQSAYETMKLHLIFDDPAIILKKELMRIPLWGWYAKKAEMIAIDRQKGKNAIDTMIGGTKHVLDNGRPVVLFPQGTRVKIGDKRPYKHGIIRLYKHFNLPIVPVALNSGEYWARNSFIKKPGVVTFKFLPALPAHQDENRIFEELRSRLETESDSLLGKK